MHRRAGTAAKAVSVAVPVYSAQPATLRHCAARGTLSRVTLVFDQMIRLRIQAVTISVTMTTTKITNSTSPAWSQ